MALNENLAVHNTRQHISNLYIVLSTSDVDIDKNALGTGKGISKVYLKK